MQLHIPFFLPKYVCFIVHETFKNTQDTNFNCTLRKRTYLCSRKQLTKIVSNKHLIYL